jgi:hypothetical protein
VQVLGDLHKPAFDFVLFGDAGFNIGPAFPNRFGSGSELSRGFTRSLRLASSVLPWTGNSRAAARMPPSFPRPPLETGTTCPGLSACRLSSARRTHSASEERRMVANALANRWQTPSNCHRRHVMFQWLQPARLPAELPASRRHQGLAGVSTFCETRRRVDKVCNPSPNPLIYFRREFVRFAGFANEFSGPVPTTNLGVRSSNLFGRAIYYR